MRITVLSVLSVLCVLLLPGCERRPAGAGAASDEPPHTVVRRVVRVRRVPSAMQRVSGIVDAGRALVPLDSLLVVRVLDQRGGALPGARVRWSLDRGGDGSRLRVVNEMTDRNGLSRAAFTPGRTANPQGPAAVVDGVGRIEFTFTVPVIRVRVAEESASLWSGDAVTVGVALLDAAGTTLEGGLIRWGQSDSAVLRVTPMDSTHALVTGALAGTATLAAWIGQASGEVRFTVHPVTTGTIETLDGSPVPPLTLEVSGDGWRDTVAVTRGAFHVRVPPRDETDAHFRVVPSGARYHDAHVRVLSPRDLHVVNIVLVPTTWRIDAGTYRGRDVAIDAAAAMRPVAGRAPFWRLAPLSGRGPKTLLGWRPSDLPIRIAFNHERQGAGIGPADSIAFWTAARQMETDIGARFFEPATLAPGAGGIVAVEIREQTAAGHTFVSWTQQGDANDAVLLFRNVALMRDRHVATHELLHLLGFGHSQAWPTVAQPAGGDEEQLTPQDVAYVQVAQRLRERRERTGARPGLPQAGQ